MAIDKLLRSLKEARVISILDLTTHWQVCFTTFAQENEASLGWHWQYQVLFWSRFVPAQLVSVLHHVLIVSILILMSLWFYCITVIILKCDRPVCKIWSVALVVKLWIQRLNEILEHSEHCYALQKQKYQTLNVEGPAVGAVEGYS